MLLYIYPYGVHVTDNTQPIVTEVEAISALTSLAYCGDIAFLSCLVGDAKPSFRKRVESAMTLAMEVCISLGWTSCTDNELVWTGHEPVHRVLEAACSDQLKARAKEILDKYHGHDGKLVYCETVPPLLPQIEESRKDDLPQLDSFRRKILLYFRQGQMDRTQTTLPKPASQPPLANGSARKKLAC
jgi:hypothetical protein